MERYEEALEAYRKVLATDPNDIETLNAIGADLAHLGQLKEALDIFNRIEALDATYEPAYCQRIAIYAEQGNHDKAEEMFYLARQYKERCPHCYFHIGESQYARGQYDKALWCWQQTLELQPEYPRVHTEIANAYWSKGQYGEAQKHFFNELRHNPGDIDTLLDLGELMLEMGQEDSANDKFRQVLELEPDEATAHYHLGQLAYRHGDEATAILQFRRILRIDSTFAGAHLRLAEIFKNQGHKSEAIFHANAELAQRDLTEEVATDLGSLLISLEQYTAAENAFQRVVTKNPNHTTARHNMAVALLLNHRLEEGIEQCKLTLRSQPKHMLAMHNLALAYILTKDLPRARFWLNEAEDLAPEDPQLNRLRWRFRWARATMLVKRLIGFRK
jgi:superkiller protein 3